MDSQTVNTSRPAFNLLPEDLLLERKHSSKLVFVNRLSIVVLVLIVLFASGTLMLRLSQEAPLKKAQETLSGAESKITALKDRESQLLTLKQQLGLIDSLSGGDTKKRAVFNLMVLSLPFETQISDLGVDKNGQMEAVLSSVSVDSLETLLVNLTNQEKNSDLIRKIELNSLAVGKDGQYRFSLSITPK
ncbi:MAG: hypothetical protein UU73_C0003G0199 [Candidatus Daviesbacteria bacterium GW2011_GWA1_41_61]|uniref:Fimbrial assembly family protein n=1 Tax=Candidatus Daviesbacteria bacterium GW2011_GWA2_40_9 TaxID=1618424 RepID=A0A0G0X859_9BACT|nr:MAG: hypothetical protein UU26_C0003G0027 [Candidatus Daviesbacteria bacterium GW2011_GWC1_40_9]KKR83842.1 MAG: hypothetical protein UU29_C0001G0062 [Candidatus Daviesbacteria bacterium GW2011_GWA2_40_9]KKR93451.1 MAG: hypothetical protein UU44_C0002G0112 [Candidatus Daviesbacteria bacterium GW2011_GWB1_41_15]KKS15000.1 MAG: hypothetical protein UU73_C0003G0199 [Candidatus Daviesbacteria bacterium GW2011_GWA1_41_61]